MEFNKDTISYKRKSISEEVQKKSVSRLIISIVVFTGLSFGMSYFRMKIPLAPSFIMVDFAAFFEFIAAIAYGPVISVIICFLKSLLGALIESNNAYSVAANFFVEAVFVGIAGFYYQRNVVKKKPNTAKSNSRVRTDYIKEADKAESIKKRRKGIFIGSLIGMPVSVIIQFFATVYFVFPTLEKLYSNYGYTRESIIENYADSAAAIASHLPKGIASIIPEITEIWQGTLMFNVPISIVKLLFITLLTMLIYPYISPYLHYRKKPKDIIKSIKKAIDKLK